MPIIARLQRAVTRPPPAPVTRALWLVALVAIPTALRMALSPLLGSTLLFPTYYPAALIGTLFLGWRAGLILILLCAVAGNFFFMTPRFALSWDIKSAAGTVVFLLAAGLIVLAGGLLRNSLQRLKSANALEKRLNAELQHRMKNTLAIVQGMIRQTSKRYDDPVEFQHALNGRIMALSSAHDLLSVGRWEMCELPLLAQRAVAPFQDGARIAVHGPACSLAPDSCVSLVLALHELATNAFKYGSLSQPGGTVELTWRDLGDKVCLRWIERDGPPVTPPTRRGMGSMLLSGQKGLEGVSHRFMPQGVECDITVPAAMQDWTTEARKEVEAGLGGYKD